MPARATTRSKRPPIRSPWNQDLVRQVGPGAVVVFALLSCAPRAAAQAVPPVEDPRLHAIAVAPNPARIRADITRLAGFGTRHTLSDTTSATRGIGAARRWLRAEFERIGAACGGCLEVFETRTLVSAGTSGRIFEDVVVVNVVAIQRGADHPNRYVMMSGDIDSRVSDANDATSDSPGANDNASGLAGVLEAARVLTAYRFPSSIVYAGLSGEEQGLYGGQHLADRAVEEGWDLVAVLNNDMIGNIEGIDGVIDNSSFRVFSEPMSAGTTERDLRFKRFYGGEVDGPSRQIARYVARMAETYFPNLKAVMIYRLDRFGRGGHHRPFNDAGFAGVRIMETHEHYDRQHQDIRMEDGVRYGDVLDGVNFEYAASITGLNAVTLAALAWGPPAPEDVQIGGAVRASAVLAWSPADGDHLAGYRVYWRDTTAPQWSNSRFVGRDTTYTFHNLVIDNYLFGVAAVAGDGNESPVVFPSGLLRRR